MIKFSENQSAPKLENRKTSPFSPCAPNLLHVLPSRMVGWHNLCSPDAYLIPTQTLSLAHWRTKAFFCRSALCSTRRATSQTVQAPTWRWRYIDSEIWQLSKFDKRRKGRKMMFSSSFKKWWLHPRDCIVVWWSCYLKGCQWRLEVTLTLQHQRDGQYPHVAQSLDTSLQNSLHFYKLQLLHLYVREISFLILNHIEGLICLYNGQRNHDRVY